MHFLNVDPKGRPRERRIEIEPRINIEGWFTVELIDAKTQIVKQKLRFRNLITNAGLDYLGTGSAVGLSLVTGAGGGGYCGLGTGSTAPANGDTTLVTEIAPAVDNRSTSTGGYSGTYGYTSGTPDYHYITRVYFFSETQANGNLTEVGIFSASTGGTMWTRQLLKDGGGTPTTVVKTASDQLKVTYEMRMQPLQSDASLSRTISTVAYTITVRARNAGTTGTWGYDGNGGALVNFGTTGTCWSTSTNHAKALETGTLGARTSEPTGSQTSASSITWAAYSGATYYRDMTAKWEPAVANFAGGIGSAVFLEMHNGDQLFQSSFSPAFAKDNTMRLTLVARISWGRV